MSLILWTVAPLLLIHGWFYRRNAASFRFQLLLDLILAAVIGPALLVGGDLNPVSCLKGKSPFRHIEWSEHTGFQPTQGDLVYQIHPWWDETRRQIRRGEMPRIQPGVGAGLPLLANGQTGLWAPVMLPVWLHGPERGTTIMAFWKLELAGLGTFFLFFVAWRLRWTASAAGGIAWAASPYLIGWLITPLSWVIVALPWCWWGVWWATRKRAPRWSAWALGLGFGWLIGCGLNPQTAVVVCGSAFIAAICFHSGRWARVLVLAAVAVPVALVLSWPTLGYIKASSRAEIGAGGAANRERMPWSMQRDLVRQIAVPASMGHPGRVDWRPAYPHAPGAAGVGGVVLALLASGRIRRRYRRIALAAGISFGLGLILLVRIPPLDTLLVKIPPLDQMTVPRFAVLIPWGLVVVAALSLDGALRGQVRSRIFRLVPALLVAAFALWAAPWSLAPVDIGLVLLSLAMAVIVGLFRGWRFVPALVAVELALLATGINPVASAADRLPKPPLVERLVELEARNPCRIVGTERAFAPNLAPRYNLRDLRAFDPLRPAPFARLMGVMGEPTTILGGPLKRAPAGLCGAWGVGLAVTPPGRELAGWQKEYADRDGAIWSNPLLLPEIRVVGRVIEEPDDVLTMHDFAEVVDFETTALVGSGASHVDAGDMTLEVWRRIPTLVEVSVECDGPCLVVVAQPWAPGWFATVDDDPATLVRTNVAGLGVVAPAGRHAVAFEYHPWRWRTGLP